MNILMLLAFLLNALIPSLTLAAAPSFSAPQTVTDASELDTVLNKRFIICTPEGVKWVTWAELQGEPSAPAADTPPKCILCTLPTFGTTATLVSFDVTISAKLGTEEKHQYAPPADNQQVGIPYSCGFLTRAPPLRLA